MTKDYTLLRPFDLEKAKAGEAICVTDGEVVTYIGMFGNGSIGYDRANGSCGIRAQSLLYMAPLAWVEGKPVYKGDVLYNKHSGDKRTIVTLYDKYDVTAEELHPNTLVSLENLTWTPPKKTREIKLLGYKYNGQHFALEEGMPVMVLYERRTDLDSTVTVEE